MPWSYPAGSAGKRVTDCGFRVRTHRQCGVAKEIFDKAMVTTMEEALASAARIGYPVMLKASEGGGGKVRLPWRSLSVF